MAARHGAACGAAVFCASAALYASTAYPGYAWGVDGTGGAVGSPLYGAFGNLLVYFSGAVWTGSAGAGALAAALYGLAPAVWRFADGATAEVHVENLAAAAAVLAVLVCNAARPAGGRRPRTALEAAEGRMQVAAHAAAVVPRLPSEGVADVRAAAREVLSAARDPAHALPAPPPYSFPSLAAGAPWAPAAAVGLLAGAATAASPSPVLHSLAPALAVFFVWYTAVTAAERGPRAAGQCLAAAFAAFCLPVAAGAPSECWAHWGAVAAAVQDVCRGGGGGPAVAAAFGACKGFFAGNTLKTWWVVLSAAGVVAARTAVVHRYLGPELVLAASGAVYLISTTLLAEAYDRRAPQGCTQSDGNGLGHEALLERQRWVFLWCLVCTGLAKAVHGALEFAADPYTTPAGVAAIDAAVARAAKRRPAAAAGWWWRVEAVLLMLACAVAAAGGCAHYAALDRSGDGYVEGYGRALLGPLPEQAVLVTASDAARGAVAYLQQRHGMRPDVVHVSLRDLTSAAAVRRAAVGTGRAWFAVPEGGAMAAVEAAAAKIDRRQDKNSIERFKLAGRMLELVVDAQQAQQPPRVFLAAHVAYRKSVMEALERFDAFNAGLTAVLVNKDDAAAMAFFGAHYEALIAAPQWLRLPAQLPEAGSLNDALRRGTVQSEYVAASAFELLVVEDASRMYSDTFAFAVRNIVAKNGKLSPMEPRLPMLLKGAAAALDYSEYIADNYVATCSGSLKKTNLIFPELYANILTAVHQLPRIPDTLPPAAALFDEITRATETLRRSIKVFADDRNDQRRKFIDDVSGYLARVGRARS